MIKRTNKYKLTLEQIALMKEDTIFSKPLMLEFENHDEIFRIIDIMRDKNLFGDENQSIEFAIGLKMFSEVLLKNRNHPVVKDFFPSFADFMKKLKS